MAEEQATFARFKNRERRLAMPSRVVSYLVLYHIMCRNSSTMGGKHVLYIGVAPITRGTSVF